MMLAHADTLTNTVDREEMEQYMEEMMGGAETWMHQGVAQYGYGQIYGFFHLVSWLLVMALLVAATRYLWNKGGDKK